MPPPCDNNSVRQHEKDQETLMSGFRNIGNLLMIPWRLMRYRPLRGGWLPDHLLRHRPLHLSRVDTDGPLEVIVAVVDHFEPAGRHGPQHAVESVAAWCEKYAAIARNHTDADGRFPQHTWFYRAEYPNYGCTRVLGDCCFGGFGEIEFHLHHGRDTHETFFEKLRAGLDFFNQTGAMLTAEAEPRRRFAYIAGNWALDNGVGDDAKSGCNTELIALRDAGCYADFTFPAIGSRAQPRKSNSIYYATDTPQAKSYDTGVDVAVGRRPTGDLLIFQGPTTLHWRAGRVEDAAIESFSPPAPDRLNQWLRANIHVRGRPEWVFVKLHCHGMQSRSVLGGPQIDALFETMVDRWNRPPLRLHFATAREAYNIAKAAEAGMVGNPNEYRDFDVAPPANRCVCCDRPWRLLGYDRQRVVVQILEPGPAWVRFADRDVRAVRGTMERLDLSFRNDRLEAAEVTGEGEIEVDTTDGSFLVPAGKRFVRDTMVQPTA